MGVGQPLSMKLKNVHLPQPHPNNVFRDPSLGGGLVLPPLGLVSISSRGFFCIGSKHMVGEGLVLPSGLAPLTVGFSEADVSET